MKLSKDISELINIFKIRNRQLYLVGGAVRDLVMGKAPNDYDFATDATPGEMLSWSLVQRDPKFKVIPTGADFGTVTFLINDDIYEITTFRLDHDCDGRHTEVTFSQTIEDDLARRDFTINAMAIDVINGNKLIDLYNGKADIELGAIEAVGNPLDRFEEDHLRMLRAVRFAARYNFEIEFFTYDAIIKNAHKIKKISKERISAEILKAAKCNNFSKFVHELNTTGLAEHIFGDSFVMLKYGPLNKYHNLNPFMHTLKVIDEIEKLDATPLEKIAAMFHDIGKSKSVTMNDDGSFHFYGHDLTGAMITDKIMKDLKFSNKNREFVVDLVKNHMVTKPWKDEVIVRDKSIRKLVRNQVNLDSLLKLIHADNMSHHPNYNMPNQVPNIRERMKSLDSGGRLKVVVPINGKDIMNEFNIKPGRLVGAFIAEAEEFVLEYPAANKYEILEYLSYVFEDELNGEK